MSDERTEYRILPSWVGSDYMRFALQFKDTITKRKYWFGPKVTYVVWRFIPTIEHAVQRGWNKKANCPTSSMFITQWNCIAEPRNRRDVLMRFAIKYKNIDDYFEEINRENNMVKEAEYLIGNN
jgi:hypothetical protein